MGVEMLKKRITAPQGEIKIGVFSTRAALAVVKQAKSE